MRILLVEDDIMIGEALCIALKDAAYAVDWVKDGDSALLVVAQQAHQVVLLDLGLPKRDGIDVLRQMRNAGNSTPIMIMTARDAIEQRIQGLDLGADDYLVKPFAMNELLARLRAIIRRQGGQSSPLLSNGHLQLDPNSHLATFEQQQAQLSAKEFALLHALILFPGRIFSRHELEDQLYGWNEEVESNAVDFLIHAIRKKLGSAVIKNIRGAGWMVAKYD